MDLPDSWKNDGHFRPLSQTTIRSYYASLSSFTRFVKESDLPIKYLPGQPNFELPPATVLRRFAQSHAAQGVGRGRIQPVQCVVSVQKHLGNLLGAIEVLTGQPFDDDIVADIRRYVGNTLLAEGLVTDRTKRKFEFDRDDCELVQRVLWTQLDPACNSQTMPRTGRFLVFFSAVLYLFNVYGSRISAMMPKYVQESQLSIEDLWGSVQSEEKLAPSHREEEGTFVSRAITGLRYRDIRVELFRKSPQSDEVEPIVTLTQRFFKGNTNIEEKGLIAWGRFLENSFLQDYMPFVLAYAFGDNAFSAYPTPESLLKARISPQLESLTCQWREEFLDVHIFRESAKSDKPFTQGQWNRQLQVVSKQAGYTEQVTPHRIRQATTNAINRSGITGSEHHHLFGQKIQTFQKKYMDVHTHVDAQGIMSGDIERPDIAQKLQSAKRTICRNLPSKLTLEQKHNVMSTNPELLELRNSMRSCKDGAELKKLRNRYTGRRKIALKKRLQEEQQSFYENQQNPAAEIIDDICNGVSLVISRQRWQRTTALQPQIARVAQALISKDMISSADQRISFLNDLAGLVRQEQHTLEGTDHPCTFSTGGLHYVTRYLDPENERREYRYCYICLTWVCRKQLDSHFQQIHLDDVPMDCGIFYLTSERGRMLLNPGLCPFCLADSSLTIGARFHFYVTKRKFVDHLWTHLFNLEKSANCPHPKCQSEDMVSDIAQHLEIRHGIEQAALIASLPPSYNRIVPTSTDDSHNTIVLKNIDTSQDEDCTDEEPVRAGSIRRVTRKSNNIARLQKKRTEGSSGSQPKISKKRGTRRRCEYRAQAAYTAGLDSIVKGLGVQETS